MNSFILSDKNMKIWGRIYSCLPQEVSNSSDFLLISAIFIFFPQVIPGFLTEKKNSLKKFIISIFPYSSAYYRLKCY